MILFFQTAMNRCIYLALAPLAALLASCGSVSDLQPTAEATGKTYSRVIVKDFKYSGDPEQNGGPQSSRNFADKIAAELKDEGSFSSVARSGSATKDALVISGDITKFTEGAASLRLWVGMGAGNAEFDSTVTFSDGASGKSLGTISAEKHSYSGGGAISASQTPDSLMQGAAESVASQAASFAKK
jgi:hypothetical protein